MHTHAWYYTGGHYDRSKTVSENLKLCPALLSRFDLIFILFDSPDAGRDQMLSEHVISLHSGKAKHIHPSSQHHSNSHFQTNPGFPFSASSSSTSSSSSFEAPTRLSLSERLHASPAEMKALQPLTPSILRKYIG